MFSCLGNAFKDAFSCTSNRQPLCWLSPPLVRGGMTPDVLRTLLLHSSLFPFPRRRAAASKADWELLNRRSLASSLTIDFFLSFFCAPQIRLTLNWVFLCTATKPWGRAAYWFMEKTKRLSGEVRSGNVFWEQLKQEERRSFRGGGDAKPSTLSSSRSSLNIHLLTKHQGSSTFGGQKYQ